MNLKCPLNNFLFPHVLHGALHEKTIAEDKKLFLTVCVTFQVFLFGWNSVSYSRDKRVSPLEPRLSLEFEY